MSLTREQIEGMQRDARATRGNFAHGITKDGLLALCDMALRYAWLRDKSTPDNGMFYLASASTQARFMDPAFVDAEVDTALKEPND